MSVAPVPSRKYLVLDDRVIERTENARVALGTVEKDPDSPFFTEDRPWEARGDNMYCNVLYDEDDGLYKCWYNPFIEFSEHGRETALCYAVSRDGIAWEKPELGICEFDGSTANNIVKRMVHGAGVRKDTRETDPERRFKLFYKTQDEEAQTPEMRSQGLMWMRAATSPDGIRWTDDPRIRNPFYRYKQADTHNNFIRDERTGKYVAITRTWDRDLKEDRTAIRLVARMESADFLKWTRPVDIFRELPEEFGVRQTYAMPIFEYQGLYLGLVMMFNCRKGDDTVDCELTWSPDTIHWHRVCPGQSIIPRGPEGDFDSHIVFGACSPIFEEGAIRLYYAGCNGPHGGERQAGLGLARLRPDGFAGMEPESRDRTATAITRPVECGASKLVVSADAEGGSLRAAVLDAEGRGLADCAPIRSNVTNGAVTWSAGNLAGLAGKRVRLRFELDAARLYAFGFEDR